MPTVADFGDGTSPAAHAIGRQFFAACRDVGFAYLINTPIAQDAIDDMFQWVSSSTRGPAAAA